MNNRDQNSHGGTGNDPRHLTKDEMREKIKASLAAKEASEFHPETPKSTSQRFSGQAYRSASGNSAAERSRSEKARQIRDAVSSSHRSEPQTPPSRSGQPRNNESREIPQRRQQPRQSNTPPGGGAAYIMWLWQSAPALFRPGTMKKSGKSVTEAVSPSLPASQCWQSCC